MIDPIVEEIHKIREEYAAKFGYDVDAMFEDLRRKQSNSNRKVVSFSKDTQEKRVTKKKKVA
ncbi:MAG: hypothetical protein H7Z37_14845 [Pyrinomonadaceae bacterium]|nr:hypothetical protein [Pyrinomonadaceae bacterium]